MSNGVALRDPRDPFSIYRTWWGDLANRHAPGTVRRWRFLVLRTMADLGCDPIEITRGELARYLETFRAVHGGQIRLALLDFFRYTQKHGFRLDNPIADVPTPRRAGRLKIKRSLTEDEVTRILVALVWRGHGHRRWTGDRLALLALGHYLTGVRPGELMNLTTDRIHLNGSTSSIEIVGTKTGNDRIVPLGTAARDVFAQLTEGRAGGISDIGTTRYWEIVRLAAFDAGIPKEKARPYAFRHSFARHLLDRGVDERTVADLLGHTDLRHIWGYTVPGDDQRRRAVELLGGDLF